MPLPKRNEGETDEEFISRCLRDPKIQEEFGKQSRSSDDKPCCGNCAEGKTCAGEVHSSDEPSAIIIANSSQILSYAAKVTEEMIGKQRHLTFPVVMAVEGVRQAANSPAPELILRAVFEKAIRKQQDDEIRAAIHDEDENLPDDEEKSKKKKTWRDWQLPLVYTHPMRGNVYVSVKERYDSTSGRPLGYLDNIRWEGTKLIGQAHLSLKLAEKAGEGMLVQVERIRRKNIVEVSMGHSAVVMPVSGSFKGKRFYGIHMKPMLDHLAILRPQDRGACSVKDGCGTPRE